MASRDLVYRVTLDTSQARRAAQNIRQTIEAELRTIQVGQLNISSLTAATNEAQRFRYELEQAAQAASNIQVKSGAIPQASPSVGTGTPAGGLPNTGGGLAGGLVGGLAAGAVVAGIKEIGSALDDLSRRGAVFSQINDVLKDYAASVGTTGDAIVSAAKKAAQGTISEYELILNANRAIQFEVAKTPEQYAKLIELSTALGRAQGISDTQALEYLTTGLARESRLILDNLGLIINLDEATGKYAATIGKTADELTASERKQALLQAAFEQGAVAIAANRDAADSAATQYERFDANVQDLKDTFGAWLAEASADKIGAIADAVKNVNDALNGEGDLPDWLLNGSKAIEDFGKLIEGPKPSAIDLAAALKNLGVQVQEMDATFNASQGVISHADAIIGLGAAANDAKAKVTALAEAEKAERQAQLAREDSFSTQQDSVNKSLDNTAEKSVGALGLEPTIALLKEQKAQVDAAIQELIASSVTDPAEIGLRVAEIQQAAQQAFADAVANAPVMPEIDPGITAGSFDIISQSLTDLNQGFVDFLPNMAAARDELIALQTEVALTGITTEEQAAALEYLSSAALAVADDTGLLAEMTNELGVSFLAANPEAAGIVDAMYAAQASYLSGAITAEQYAGMLSVLGGQLLGIVGPANAATGAILALVAAQGGLAGTAGFAQGQQAGGGVASRLKVQEDQRAREASRKAAEKAARDAEAAAKRAAREQESAAKRAGKELENAAKKAAQELKSALDKVPGLFRRTQVTEGDMNLSKAGVYQDKADEYLRRLEAEVKEGKDIFANVSIADARQSLTDLGVQVAEDNNVAFQQFVDAYESGLLFADKGNIEKYINKDAVERELELQKKAEEGRNNVYEAFGVAIDGAVEAAVAGVGGVSASAGGISAGSTGAGITIPVKGELIPMTAADTTGATGGGGTFAITPMIDTQAIQDQLNLLTLPEFQVTAMGLADLQSQIDAISPTIRIKSSLDGESFAALFEKVQSTKPTIAIKSKLNDTDFADFLTKVESTRIGLAPVFTATPTNLSELAVAVETQAQINIPVGLYSTLETMQELKAIVEMTKISIPVTLSAQNADGSQSDDLALGFVGELNRQFQTNANFFYAAGQVPAQNVLGGYKGYFTTDSNEGAPLVTPMVTAINTQIRIKAEDFKNQGLTIAQYVQAGVSVGFNSESFKSALVAVGESLYASIRTGLVNAADGGDLVESLGNKILADLATEVEAP